MFRKIKLFLQKNKLTGRIVTNYGFRTVVFSLCSFAVGTAYAVFNLAVGIAYRSPWYYALACYYIMLGVIRGGVLLNRHKAEKRDADAQLGYEIRQYLLCGILLIVMTIFLGTMVAYIVVKGKTFEYPLSVIYMMAGYTIYRIAISAYNFRKARRTADYTVRALRCVNLATALVSVLSLQSAALTAFSRNVNQIFMNALTGGLVCLLVVSMGVFMIVSAAYRLKKLRRALCR